MQMYRSITSAVQQAESRLHIVLGALNRGPDVTLADVAREHRCSEAQVCKLQKTVLDALIPRTPGRKPRAPATPTPAAIGLAPVPAADAPVDDTALILTLVQHHVGIRGIQDVLVTLTRPPRGRDTLVQTILRAGRAARRLMTRAIGQVQGRMQCLSADDIFFHRKGVKVLMDPVSNAVLDVMRWPWHEGEDWALWLAPWPALRLLVSDLGTDLVGACNTLAIPQQADVFHERQWWNGHVFQPLSRREQKLADQALGLLDQATRVQGPGRRLGADKVEQAEAERAEVERQFYVAVEAEERLLALFEPLDPHERCWTPESMEDAMDAICAALVKLPNGQGSRIWNHVYRHRARWCAHRVLWDAISIEWREDSTLTREALLQIATELVLSERPISRETPWKSADQRTFDAYERRELMRAQCANAAAVEASVRSLMLRPRRSSSLVECFNSRLRVLQMVHRNVSDELLAIHALIWNLRPRSEGKHRGQSPYARLGIDFADDLRSWQQILVEEMNRN